MLDNLLFSINAVIPLFLMLFLGYTFKKLEFISGGFVTSGNKMVFYVALPAALFRSVYMAELGELLDMRFAAFAVGASLIAFVGVWLAAVLFIKSRPIRGTFTQGAIRGNFAFLGMPLLISLAGDAGAARAALIMVFVLPLYNICSILVLAACSDSDKKVGFKTIAFTIVKNPFIIAIVLAFGVQLIGIRLPFMMTQTVVYAANMATPLALICLGAGMYFQGFDTKFRYALIASLVKVIVLPVLFVAAGYMMGFRGYDIAAILVLGGVPSALAGYAMVVQIGGDSYVAATIIVMSTFISAFTLTLFIYVLRVLGVL
ncbi:MAG: AEC family transporter [Defluviitaleaceae bacterium]|nr:AEC family transporter [Defluviitaleaceae bacterium]